jgi:hemoglobin
MAPIFHFKSDSKPYTSGGISVRSSARILQLAAALACMLIGLAAQGATLYESMGGDGPLRSAVDRFAVVIMSDDRINFAFADTDMAKFKELLFQQLCNLSGGPCKYTGRDMHTAHAKLNINVAEFNALTEDLYIGLGQAGIPYRLQNKLVSLLAPMKHQIVKAGTAPG